MATSLLGLFLAGLLTFVSPCVLPLIPAYLAALGAGGQPGREHQPEGRGRTVAAAAAFLLGMSLVFVSLGAGASAVGARLAAQRPALLGGSGVLMLLLGLRGTGLVRLSWLDRDARPALTRVRVGGSLLAAFLFGGAFALGWSPCIGPLLASALAYAASHAATPWRGAGLLSVYAAGLALPFLVVALLADRAAAGLRRVRTAIPVLERATGVLLVAVGVWTLAGVWREAHPSKTASLPLAVEHGISATPGGGEPTAVTLGSGEPLSACGGAVTGTGCALPTEVSERGTAYDLTGPRLLEFVAAECPVCRTMAPVLAKAEAECQGLGAKTVRVDVGTQSGLTLAREFRVLGTPTFVLLGEDNLEHARLVGEQPASELEAAIEVAFGARCAMPAPKPSSSS